MDDQEWTVYEWRLTPSDAQRRTVDLLLLALVGSAVVVAVAAAVGDWQFRMFAIPAGLLAVAGAVWQRRDWSTSFRMVVNSRRDLVVHDGRGRRVLVELPGARVELRRRAVRGLRVGDRWRWIIDVRSADGELTSVQLPVYVGWGTVDADEVRAVADELARHAGQGGPVPDAVLPEESAAARRNRDRTRFEWRHPRLAEIARLRRRLRFAFGLGVAAVATATAIALWGEDLSAVSPTVGIGVGIVLLVVAVAVDWVFRLPFRWVLRVDSDGVLRVTSGSRRRDVRLSGASDVVVGRRRREVADGELGTEASGWAVAVRRPDGDRFEAPIPCVAGWAELEPGDAVALERVLRRRAGLPVDPGR